MSYPWLTAISAAKLLAVFLLFFIIVPARLIPQPAAPWAERFQHNLVLMVWLVVVLVHLLSLINLYSIIMLLLLVATLFVLLWLLGHDEPPGQALTTAWQRSVVWVLDLADDRVRLGEWLATWARSGTGKLKAYFSNTGHWIHLVLFLLVLGVSAWLRFSDALSSAATVYSDPYSHLLWMKQLQVNMLYGGDGVNQFYPRGFPAFAAVLDGLTALDGAMAMRLVGPLVGTLLVVGVYFVGRKLTGSPDLALLGMFLYGVLIDPLNLLQSIELWGDDGLTISPVEPGWFVRQTASLSFEFALLFLMPSLFAIQAYLREPSRRTLVLSGAGVMVMSMSNLLIAAVSGIGVILAMALVPLFSAAYWQHRLQLALVVGLGFVLGTLQYFYGAVFGDNTADVARQTAAWFSQYASELPYTLELVLSAGVGLLLFLLGLFGFPRDGRSLWWRNVGALLILLALLSRISNWGYVYLLPPDRLDMVRLFLFCGSLPVVFQLLGLPVSSGARALRWRPIHQSILGFGIVVGTWWAMQSPLPAGPRFEYDALARVTFEIKRRFPPLQWTLVSLTEDFSKVFQDKGWHMNAAAFLDQYDPYEAEPDLPTPYVFLYVEKRPFKASSDPGLNVPGVRRDIERRMLEWTTVYGLLHDDISIYFENWDVIVYKISRDPGPSPGQRSGFG